MNAATDSNRYNFGDLDIWQGTLDFNGTYDGALAPDILIEMPGTFKAGNVSQRTVQVLPVVGGEFIPCDSYIFDNGGVTYLRIIPDKTKLGLSDTRYITSYNILTIY